MAGMLATLLLATTPTFAQSAFDGAPPSPFWGNFQWGLTFLQRSGAAMEELNSSSQYWRIAGGMRLHPEWMIGIGTHDVPLASYNKLSQLYATVLFNPDRGPWVYEAALGKAKYRAAYSDGLGSTLHERHSGLSISLGAGYDWTPSIRDIHVGARLNLEYSRLGQADLGPGSFNHSRLSLGVSASFY